MAAEPAHTTLAGEVVLYYILPVMVLLTMSVIGFAVWVVRSIGTLNQGLAIVVQDVNPPDKPSLRELVTDIRIEQAKVAATLDQGNGTPPRQGRR